MAYSAMPTLVMAPVVPLSETAAANGLNTLMRSLGTSFSSAVLGAILTHEVVAYGPVRLPSESAFRTVFLCAFAAAVVAMLL